MFTKVRDDDETHHYQNINHVNRLLEGWNSFVLFLYAILLVLAVHNTIKFLIKERRYENLHLSYFYVLVYLIIFVRVTWLSLIIIVACQYDAPDPESY